ncbi:hypothetical protein EDD17DRAFT_1718722 [Pisolithus thermaeus]|nr:hypothetical protein EDD17DRAFT_1718722 [Pisolithus thermaeus]
MPSLPQNVTFLGRFLTVQSMAHHAVACLLVFEHSYYLMLQGNYVWEEALAFSVEKYKNSQVQETIFQALKVAFQQHGNNLEDLCDTIVKIIRENKMSL